MSKIIIERDHQLGSDGAKSRIVEIQKMLKDRFGVELAWSGHDARVSGSAVKGSVKITDNHLSVDLKLGLLARPFAGKIRRTMEEKIDEALV